MDEASRVDDCILQEILSRLPAKSLAQCKCISKRWHDLISSPLFVKTQAARSLHNPLGILTATARGGQLIYIPLESDANPSDHPDTTLGVPGLHMDQIHVRAASNGLLFCRVYDWSTHILGNLTTKSFHRVTRNPNDCPDVRYGLAFDPFVSPSNVKLVACRRTEFGRQLKFDVYSFSKRRWMASVVTVKSENARLFDTVSSVYVGGALHWLVERGDMVAFDAETEQAYTVRLPEGVEATPVAGYSDVWLGVVKGRMSIVKIDRGINVWEMEEYKSGIWELKKCVKMPEDDDDGGGRRGYHRRNVPLVYDGEKCVMLTWTGGMQPSGCGLAVYRFGSGRWDPIRKLQGWMDHGRHFCPYISHSIEVNLKHDLPYELDFPRKRPKYEKFSGAHGAPKCLHPSNMRGACITRGENVMSHSSL